MRSAVALFASSRRNGNTGRLMDWVADALKIEVIDLAQRSMSAFDYEHKNRGDDFEPLLTGESAATSRFLAWRRFLA